MKADDINPFVEGVLDFFTKMLGASAERGVLGLSRSPPSPQQVTAIIGLGGRVRGTISLCFPVPTALNLFEALSGVKTKVVDEEVYDAVMEAANIVAGSAKSRLVREDEEPIQLGLPSVVRGSDYDVYFPRRAAWLDIPFTSTLGPFQLRVAVEPPATKGGQR